MGAKRQEIDDVQPQQQIENQNATQWPELIPDATTDAKLCLLGLNDLSSSKFHLPSGNMSLRTAAKGCRRGDVNVVLEHNPAAVSVEC